jgi:hypothetical protein
MEKNSFADCNCFFMFYWKLHVIFKFVSNDYKFDTSLDMDFKICFYLDLLFDLCSLLSLHILKI